MGEADEPGVGGGEFLGGPVARSEEHRGEEDEAGDDQHDGHDRRPLGEFVEFALERQAENHRGDRADDDDRDHPATGSIEPGHLHEVLAEVHEHGDQRAEVKHRRRCEVGAIASEQGRNEDEVSARGDREELGESLDHSPQDGVQHWGEVRRVLTAQGV